MAPTTGRRRPYIWMMGTCLVLFALSGLVVRHFSTPLAVAMVVVAALLPPAAAIVANAGVLEAEEPEDPDAPDPWADR